MALFSFDLGILMSFSLFSRSKAASPPLSLRTQLFLIIQFHSPTVLSFWVKMACVVLCWGGGGNPRGEGKKRGGIWGKKSDFQLVNCESCDGVVGFFPSCLSVCLSAPSSENTECGGNHPTWGSLNITQKGLQAETFPIYWVLVDLFVYSWGDSTRKVTFLPNKPSRRFSGAIRCDGSSSCCFLFHFKCLVA